METVSDGLSDWSDSSDESSLAPAVHLQSRAYQLEMFEESMRQNIIVTMSTGSGKTQVAKMRIEAELERSPGKRIWFTTPSVVLGKPDSIHADYLRLY